MLNEQQQAEAISLLQEAQKEIYYLHCTCFTSGESNVRGKIVEWLTALCEETEPEPIKEINDALPF